MIEKTVDGHHVRPVELLQPGDVIMTGFKNDKPRTVRDVHRYYITPPIGAATYQRHINVVEYLYGGFAYYEQGQAVLVRDNNNKNGEQ